MSTSGRHGKFNYIYGDDSSQSQSSTDLWDFTGIEGQRGKDMCQGGNKPDTGKFHSSYIGMNVQWNFRGIKE